MTLEAKLISEKENRIQEFTVHFWNDQVRIDSKILPTGQISADVLNLSDELILDLRYKADEMLKIMSKKFFNPETEKNPALVSAVQERLNGVLNIVLTLPLFEHLNMDAAFARNMLTTVYTENLEEFQRMLLPGAMENALFVSLLKKLAVIPDELHTFRIYIGTMLDFFFERLKRRNAEYYAVAVYDFFSNQEIQKEISAALPPPPAYQFLQARGAMIEYTTMPDPENPKKYIVAERMVFDSIASFLHADFFRGLMNGNAPRRCHNCKRFFLLSNGYDTCYCNNIAPGETEKTCRKIGAHKKEARKEGKTPVRLEYDKVYNRLKTRRARGKLSADEWNAAVSLALDYKDKAEAGKITDLELREIYDKM
ncbi:MAG TPA: DUF6076 domain-containing protein [Syntrophomonas sp.]|nr:DUF6076 domain-containing protein [Syntrophomonas sp.]